MSTLVKEVEGEDIRFDETTLPSRTAIVAGWCVFVALGVIMCLGALEHDYGLTITTMCLTLLWIIPLLSILIGAAFGQKGYYVSTNGKSIEIRSTTPEADQIAICKAAQDLEATARENAKHKRELKAIAARCK